MSNIKDWTVNRRKVLKGIGAAGVAAAVPGVVNAGLFEKTGVNVSASGSADSNGLSIELSDAGASNVDADLLLVSVSNLSDETKELKQLSPAAITMDGKNYNLNSMFSGSSISVKSNSVQHYWLSPSRYDTGAPSQRGHSDRVEPIVVNIIRGSTRVRESQHAQALVA